MDEHSSVETVETILDVDQILLYNRNVFLSGLIDDEKADKINKQLLALSIIDNTPIALWINSPGGDIFAGLAIIDMMLGLRCPVYTFINGVACSMAAIISIAGKQRVITTNSRWMIHDGFSAMDDYFSKLEDQIQCLRDVNKQINNHIKKYTKLTIAEIENSKKGGLWLNAKQCKQKGIVDVIAKV